MIADAVVSADVPPALLTCQSLSRTVGEGRHQIEIVREVSLTIEENEFVALTGASGSGKSTLLALLGLLDTPSSGRYQLNGIETVGMSRAERARMRRRYVGIVFQSFNLLGDLSVRDNVELALRYQRVPRRERAEAVAKALAAVRIPDLAGNFPYQLSGGEQQRVAVARAIVGMPKVVLADEPTGNLDTRNGEAIMDLLVELVDLGSTVCMVTHDPRFARYAHRELRMADGVLADA